MTFPIRNQTAWVVVLGLLLAVAGPLKAAGPIELSIEERTDLAIDAGLRWLAERQIREGALAGSWPSPRYPSAVASLAGLAFLAAGHTPDSEPYGPVIQRALKYVMSTQTSDGYAGNIGDTMYVHSVCTLFALSCLGMQAEHEQDQELAEWCQRALDVIVQAQKVPKPAAHRGGWRYRPTSQDSDLSNTSWIMQVLMAARQCGFEIDESVINMAMAYVNNAYVDMPEEDMGGFVYMSGRDDVPGFGVTGAALYIKAVFEEQTDEKMVNALKFLETFEPGWGGAQYNGHCLPVTWYMMLGYFQIGGEAYDRFLKRIRTILLEQQRGDGHWPYPPGEYRSEGIGVGPIYPTAMAVLILSVDRQFLPAYQRQRNLFQ